MHASCSGQKLLWTHALKRAAGAIMGQQREPCQARRRVCAHTAAALGLCHQAVLVPRYVRVSQCVSCARAARVCRGHSPARAGMPGLWLWRFLLLLGFVVAMLPVFVPVLVHFLRSPRILKNIPYGPSIRHQLDVYLPSEAAVARARRQCPIVVFVSGGAWVIGYKLWAFLMGCVLQERGVVFVCPDYRNFPQGQAPDMVRDVAEALKWAQVNAALLGGDPKNMTLVGQSAGAHLVLMCVIEAAELEAAQGGAGAAMAGVSGRPHSPRHRRELHDAPGEHTAGGEAVCPADAEWGRGLSMAGIRRCVGVSGPYDLEALADKLAARGLPRGLLQALMGDLLHQSPVCRVRRMTPTSLRRLPPVILYHGTADLTVPCAQVSVVSLPLFLGAIVCLGACVCPASEKARL